MPTVVKNVIYELRLDLASFDLSRFEEERRHLAKQGIQLTTLARERALDASAIHRVYRVHNECRRRQPPVELRKTPIPFEMWMADFADEKGETALPDAYFIAQHGPAYIGVSAVLRLGDVRDIVHIGFTGVLPAYTGRGVGIGLKLETLRYAAAQGYREIQTDVLASNIPMLRINEALGFQRHGERVVEYTY